MDPGVPNWGRIPALAVTGAPALVAVGAGHELRLPTSAGEIVLTQHDHGLRLRVGPPVRDYGILVAAPVPLQLQLEAIDGGSRVTARTASGGALELRVGPPVRDYGILLAPPVPLALRTESVDGGSRITARTASGSALELYIGHAPFHFELSQDGRRVQASSTDGHFVRRFRLPPLARHDGRWLFTLDLGADTPVYGLGEKSGKLDKRGQWLRSYNHDALGLNAERSYKNAPFAWSPEGWGVFVHGPEPVTHGVGFGPWSQRAYVLAVEGEGLDLFVLTGADGAVQLRQYTDLTGRAPEPPPWSLGTILSKAYYKDADEILSVAREVRARGLPCEVITFDGRAWQDTDTRFAFEWCPKRYPDPKPVIDELKSMGFRICVWEYPLVSVRHPLFAEMAAKGWL
ncbi:MAG: TIM-barrel domain-containing protein, partial [Gammaproteobacteria bacterium]